MNNSSEATSPQRQNGGMEALIKLVPLALVIVLTNGIVLVLFFRRKSLRTTSNYLLLGLAISDFITGAINIPYSIVFYLNLVPLSMHTDFSFWMFALHTLMAVSVGYHILVITAEKYLAIRKPLRHHLVTKKMVFKMLVAIWMMSTVIAVIPVVWNRSPSKLLCLTIYAAVCLLVVFIVPYTFIIFAFTVMFKVISSRQIPKLQNNIAMSRFQAKNNKERKCTVIFAIMATMFAICWLPYFTLMLVINIKLYLMLGLSSSTLKVVEVFVFVRYTTSITNPLLYTFFKRDFWLALKALFGKRRFSLPSRSRLRSRSLRYSNDDVTRAVSCDSNSIFLLSWNRQNGGFIGIGIEGNISTI